MDVTDLTSYRQKKALERKLSDLRQISKITRRFYEDLKPFFKHVVVREFAKNVLDFRNVLIYNMKACKQKQKELKE